MKQRFINLIDYLGKSFDNSPGGASARKLEAFAAFLVACWVTYTYSSEVNATTMVLIWLAASLVCLGIITMEQINKFKNGDNKGNDTAP